MGKLNVLLVCAIIILVIYILSPIGCNMCSTDNYRYLGSVYSPVDGGFASEFNEECMGNENRHCVLTNGMTGKCILNGKCMASTLVDQRQEAEEVHKPYCPKPYSGGGCDRFCNCLEMQGDRPAGCVEECKSWFSPIDRNGPYD